MRNLLRIATFAWLCWSDRALAACEPTSEPLVATQPGPIARSEIRTIVMDPAVGSPVRQDTVLAIDVEYQIAGFSDAEYSLAPGFQINAYASRSALKDGNAISVTLKFAAGKARVCVPLAPVYGEDAAEVAWPLELGFSIYRDDGGVQTGVARSRSVKLNSVDVPAVALARQAKAPPPEYEDALEHVFNDFMRGAELYKVCLKRLPALQPKLTPAYRAWESRHREDIDFVTALKFESFKEQVGGRGDAAMRGLDLMAEMQHKFFEARPADQLRNSCERILAQADPGDDSTDGALGPYIEILRKWHPK